MATGYEVMPAEDGAVVVVLHPACKIAREEILALLIAAGIDPERVTFVEPADISGCGEFGGTPVVIPVDDDICHHPELEDIGRQCGTAAGAVVVLFGDGCDYDGLHPVADKFGTQCDWSADHLKGCISGADDAPRDSRGRPTTRDEAREVKCGNRR